MTNVVTENQSCGGWDLFPHVERRSQTRRVCYHW